MPRDLVDCGRQAGASPLALAGRRGWILRSFQPAELRRALQGLEATCLRAVCVEVSVPVPPLFPVALWVWHGAPCGGRLLPGGSGTPQLPVRHRSQHRPLRSAFLSGP